MTDQIIEEAEDFDTSLRDDIARAHGELLRIRMLMINLRVRRYMTLTVGVTVAAACLAMTAYAAAVIAGQARMAKPDEAPILMLLGLGFLVGTIAICWPRISVLNVLMDALNHQSESLWTTTRRAEDKAANGFGKAG